MIKRLLFTYGQFAKLFLPDFVRRIQINPALDAQVCKLVSGYFVRFRNFRKAGFESGLNPLIYGGGVLYAPCGFFALY